MNWKILGLAFLYTLFGWSLFFSLITLSTALFGKDGGSILVVLAAMFGLPMAGIYLAKLDD